MRSILSVAALGLLVSGSAQGQGRGYGPLVLVQPASTRALALGNAFVLGATDSDAIFYNPAFADQLRGISASFHVVPQPAEDGRLFTFSGGAEWWGGSAALGLQALSYDALITGPATRLASSGMVAAVAYARRFFGLRVGVTGKLIEQRISDVRSSTVAFDLATGASFGPVSVGLSAKNLGAALEFDAVYPDGNLPELITLAASTRARPTGPLDLLATAAVTSDIDGDFTGGLGIEAGYWPFSGRTFLARVGVMRDPEGDTRPTLGAGFAGDRIGIDYAYVDGGGHRVGLRWR